jgi:hypothetical protein
MPNLFPRHTVELRFAEPKAFRRFSYSLAEMAIVTGVIVRLYRLVTLTHGSNNWIYIGGVFAMGLVFLLGMVTAHLANYPLHQYLWRAPAFALIEVATEMGMSALLIAMGKEPNGTVRAHWDDWFGMGMETLLKRGLAIAVWGLVLAGVVSVVRRTLVKQDEDDRPGPVTIP